MNAPTASSSRPRAVAAAVLAALLILLAFRMTASESLRESLAAKIAAADLAKKPKTADTPDPVPIVGPLFTVSYAAIAWLLAGVATLLAVGAGALTRFRAAQLLLILLILGLLVASALQAANVFNAVIGTADLMTSLAAAWTVALVCHRRLLGERGRQAVLAAMVAVLVLGVAKALTQQFVEFPDTLEMVKKDVDKSLREQGIDPNDPVQRKLFLSRLNSAEVSGYGGLSNVFATQMIACVVLLAGLGVGGLCMRRREPPLSAETARRPAVAARRSSPTKGAGETQIPVHVIAQVGLAILLAASLGVLPLTGSKGGLLAALLATGVAVAGGILWRQVMARRRLLLATAGAVAVLLPIAVIGWGVSHHGLPTLSLLYRWQYWTASWPIIRQHPWWGVGLYNFGDYYLQFKLPSAPEEVKDPHSFFVRLAAEAGIPAMVAMGLLLVMLLRGAFTRSRTHEPDTETAGTGSETGLQASLIWGAAGLAIWLPLHFLAESPIEYTVIVTLLLALLAWGVYAAVMALFAAMTPMGTRYVALAGVIAALGMLLYDQVNMALVTGPVALLFWMLLATGDGCGDQTVAKRGGPAVWTIIALPFALSTMLLLGLVIPIAGDDFAPDPAPLERAHIQYLERGDIPGAMAALNAALDRSPNSIELLIRRINIRRSVLHQPVAADIRRVLQLDRSNAGIRLILAVPDTDLPTAERRTALEEALAFDAALPAHEFKRLTAAQLGRVRGTLARLPAVKWFRG